MGLMFGKRLKSWPSLFAGAASSAERVLNVPLHVTRIIPQPNYRLAQIVLVAQLAQRGGAQEEILPG